MLSSVKLKTWHEQTHTIHRHKISPFPDVVWPSELVERTKQKQNIDIIVTRIEHFPCFRIAVHTSLNLTTMIGIFSMIFQTIHKNHSMLFISTAASSQTEGLSTQMTQTMTNSTVTSSVTHNVTTMSSTGSNVTDRQCHIDGSHN